jgi:hypothetical protein
MSGGEVKLTARQRYWLEQIQACEASGLSATAYAASQGYKVRALYDAKKALLRKGLLAGFPARFQRVHSPAPSVGSEWRVELANGAAVRFSGAVEAAALAAVLDAVARLP